MRQDELETGSQGRVSGQMPVPQGLCRPQQGTPGQGRGEGRPAEGGPVAEGWCQPFLSGARQRGLWGEAAAPRRTHPQVWTVWSP